MAGATRSRLLSRGSRSFCIPKPQPISWSSPIVARDAVADAPPRPEEVQEDPPEQIGKLEYRAFIARFGCSDPTDGMCGRASSFSNKAALMRSDVKGTW